MVSARNYTRSRLLSYSAARRLPGSPFDAAITLTPDGTDKCKVTFDVNGGRFTMNGTGTKK